MNGKKTATDNPVWLSYDAGNARWQGGKITPEIVVLHDTAGRLDHHNSARYLLDNEVKVSVHFVIERNGEVMQQVALDRAAYHAGRSIYHGRKGVNGFSIGIEIVNPGRMRAAREDGVDGARSWFGKFYPSVEFDIHEVETPEHGHGLWMGYTEEQIKSVRILMGELFGVVPTLTDIRTHWYVSPGRKADTNPLFPLEELRSEIFGREDPVEDLAEEASTEIISDDFVVIETPGGSLNLRRWPSFNPNVVAQIPDGVPVPVLRVGEFNGRTWLKVLYDGHEGWIVERYTAPITYKQGSTGFE